MTFNWFISTGRVVPVRGCGALVAAAILFILCSPLGVSADYAFPGSTALQPLAVIKPATPDGLFQIWTGDLDLAGEKNQCLASGVWCLEKECRMPNVARRRKFGTQNTK